jgi:hypothetical protein
MPKKGVFGNKAMPLDSIRGTSVPEMPKMPLEVRIKKAKTGGFIVTCEGPSYSKSDTHAAPDMDAAMKIAQEHLESEKPEKKEEKD